SRAPNVNAYPFTTQAMPLMLKPSPLWIDGSATFTIVVSRTTISCTAASSTNAPSREFLLFDAASPTATLGRTADGPLTAVVIAVISVLPLSFEVVGTLRHYDSLCRKWQDAPETSYAGERGPTRSDRTTQSADAPRDR